MLDCGVSTALGWRGIRARTVGYCERESAACAALRSRMEDQALEPAPIWGGNLQQFPAADFYGLVDGIVAGFPCQPFSVAGKQEGREDERHLLPFILDIADAVGASVLFLENVAGLKKEFDHISGLLLQRGWDCQWGTLKAADVEASHRRERWFGVAYRGRMAGRGQRELREPSGSSGQPDGSGKALGHATGDDERRDPLPGIDGQRQPFGGSGGDVADRDNAGCQRTRPAESEGWERDTFLARGGDGMGDSHVLHGNGSGDAGTGRRGNHGLPIFVPGPNDPRWTDLLSGRPWLAPALPVSPVAMRQTWGAVFGGTGVEAESGVHELADGLAPVLDFADSFLATRADQLRIAGNGVCPQQAAWAYHQLLGRVVPNSATTPK